MPSAAGVLSAFIILVFGIIYQVYLSPLLVLGGWGRVVKPLNTEKCTDIEELKACEKLVVHTSGVVYLACAPSPETRMDWMPAGFHLNSSALRERTLPDYVVTYDPRSRMVTKLDVLGLNDARGLNLHGMDIVTDEVDSNILWVYLINHRPPLDPLADTYRVGADPAIEVFKTSLGSSTIEWTRTLEDSSIIVSPNDVVGGADGKEAWFTNDRRARTGTVRTLVDSVFGVKSTTVGYCHSDTGCKIAADELYSSNGLARTKDGNFWVASTYGGYVTIHERQADNTLVPTEVVQVGLPIDNLAASSDGSVIAATFPKLLDLMKAVLDTSLTAPSSAHRISLNTGVRKGSDLVHVRRVLGPYAKTIKLMSKVENQEGVVNFDEILRETDSFMVARGDLGMEIPVEKIFLAQKMMIYKCNLIGKPVVTATQMLESMIKSPRPTRAEATDVANAVLDGTDCVMLSGESAAGLYPEIAVKIMARICIEAESSLDYGAIFKEMIRSAPLPMSPLESLASSAVRTANKARAALIVVLTRGGTTAKLVAKYRPAVPILSVVVPVLTTDSFDWTVSDESPARQSLVHRGMIPLLAEGSAKATDAESTEVILESALKSAVKKNLCKPGDAVVVLHRIGAASVIKICVVK